MISKRSVLCAVLAILILMLSGCRSEDVNYISFDNRLDAAVHGIHISPGDSDTWGDPLNSAKVSKGSQIIIDFAKLQNGAGVYDIGVIDENGMNYDIYDVRLEKGDIISLISETDDGEIKSVTLTVTGRDESRKTYTAEIYISGED